MPGATRIGNECGLVASNSSVSSDRCDLALLAARYCGQGRTSGWLLDYPCVVTLYLPPLPHFIQSGGTPNRLARPTHPLPNSPRRPFSLRSLGQRKVPPPGSHALQSALILEIAKFLDDLNARV